VYGGIFTMGHVLLFIALYPTISLILFIFFIPCAYMGIVLALIHEVHKDSGFTDRSMFLYDNTFLAPNIGLYVMDSPLEIDYANKIH
tara:strand:- start:30 stop:290 length:261 start_codon:yes stop_codon:yes gene_type:complete